MMNPIIISESVVHLNLNAKHKEKSVVFISVVFVCIYSKGMEISSMQTYGSSG